jgi:hypothetical protein
VVLGYVHRCAYRRVKRTSPGVAVLAHVIVTPRKCVAIALLAVTANNATARRLTKRLRRRQKMLVMGVSSASEDQ